MRAISQDMDSSIVAAIDDRLTSIAAEHNVCLPLAIESGSRAWGFPSPDSDYDCRFIFVRPKADYLTPWPRRDVIETPLDEIFDVNGWDLQKALRLMAKGNAVIIEWLTSPIIYRGEEWFREEMLALAHEIAPRAYVARHYLHLGEIQFEKHFGLGKPARLKKLFYCLRPAVALAWMRQNANANVAPMHFPTLLEQTRLPDEIVREAHRLIALKAVTREMGDAPAPAAIIEFIMSEYQAARAAFPKPEASDNIESVRKAEAFFMRALSRLGDKPHA